MSSHDRFAKPEQSIVPANEVVARVSVVMAGHVSSPVKVVKEGARETVQVSRSPQSVIFNVVRAKSFKQDNEVSLVHPVASSDTKLAQLSAFSTFKYGTSHKF